MIRSYLIPILAAIPCAVLAAPKEVKPDLLRFTNGDQLHGSYQGVKEGGVVVWKRDDIDEPVELKPEKLRQVILRGGRPIESHASLGHVALINGDRIPGNVTGFDETTISIDTSFAGTLRIPRNQVGMIAPSPLGGRVNYHGPFVADEWLMTNSNFPDGIPAPKKDEEDVEPIEVPDEEKPDDLAEGEDENAPDGSEPPRLWDFSGAAWYWSHREAGTTLVRREGMPDRAILRCQLAWRNRLSLGVAFHADFMRPEEKKDENGNIRRFGPGEASAYPRLFGNSYVLHIYSNYVILYRCGFDEKDAPVIERIQATSTNIRLAESGTATLELRCNRLTGEISLFIDDDFAIQWSEGAEDADGVANGEGYAGKGAGFGFMVQTENSPVRISDIVVAEWNGMPDSARSLQVDDQDIILLANGTDRFAGRVTGYEDGKYVLEAKYGEFRFPADEVAEIRFARNKLAKPEEFSSEGEVQIRLYPIGRLSGKAVKGDPTSITLATAYAGEVSLTLDSAVILDFNPSTSFLDDWDAQF